MEKELFNYEVEDRITKVRHLVHVLDAYVLPDAERAVENRENRRTIELLDMASTLLENALEMIS